MTERQSTFRKWLVDRVSEAQMQIYAGESLADRARRLGVQTDVLVEAEQLRHERLERVGRYASSRSVISSPVRRAYTQQISLYMPAEVEEPLEAIAAQRSLQLQDVARAVVHTLLLGPDNPLWVGRQGWMIGGKVRMAGHDNQRKLCVSRGADIALNTRAARLGVSKTGLVRGALCDLIEGRLRRLIYVDVASMWNDPNKYWTGDLISAGSYDWLQRS